MSFPKVNFKIGRFCMVISIVLFVSEVQSQQNKPYYDYNSAYSQQMRSMEKERLAQAGLNNVPNSSSIKSGSVSNLYSSEGNSWGDGGAYQRRQDAYNSKVKAREEAFDASMRKFKRLSVNVDKKKENYEILVDLALQAGLTYYVARRVNEAYNPYASKISTAAEIKLPGITNKEKAEYNKIMAQGEKAREKKDIPEYIELLRKAYNIYNDPYIMNRIAGWSYQIGNYEEALKAYSILEECNITLKPAASEISAGIGRSCLMQNNFDEAIKQLNKALNKEKLAALSLRYAYYLKADDVNAYRIINETIDQFFLTPQNKLIKSYFLLKNKQFDEAIEILDKVKPTYQGVNYIGDLYKDLAAIMCKSAQQQFKDWNNNYVSMETLYVLDIAIYLDPQNEECAKTRNELNHFVNRNINSFTNKY